MSLIHKIESVQPIEGSCSENVLSTAPRNTLDIRFCIETVVKTQSSFLP